MTLESLANESLLDLFQYFDAVDLLRAFYGLNFRFDDLLFSRYQDFHLNFKSISKKDFDFICHEHLSKIIDRTISLSLSDDHETPGQIDYFLSYGFIRRQFTHLQSLSLFNIPSVNAVNKLLMDLNLLEHLSYLKIDTLPYQLEEESIQRLFKIILSLPNLTYCHLKSLGSRFNLCLKSPELICSSLKQLFIENGSCYLSEFYRLLKSTPRLENLRIGIKQDFNFSQQLSYLALSLTVLDISFNGTLHEIRNLLENLPNLYRLTIETQGLNMNGHHWDEIITHHLLKLKIFQLRMQIDFRNNDNREEQVDELLTSFRTSFWLDEHQWFVRCDWSSKNRSSYTDQDIVLYTLPYAFDTILQVTSTCSKSTCPEDRNYCSYDRVHNFSLLTHGSFKYFSQYPVRFSNIKHLTLNFPFDNSVWSIFPRLDQLISLDLFGYEHNAQFQLQPLFDQAPRLYSLTLFAVYFTRLSLRSNSIRRLHLGWLDEPFDTEQCAELCRSSLFQQCEILQIKIKTRDSIRDLIQQMPNLRALIVQCKDDKWKENRIPLSKREDKLLKWLIDCLPSNCCISRVGYRVIRLWIG